MCPLGVQLSARRVHRVCHDMLAGQRGPTLGASVGSQPGAGRWFAKAWEKCRNNDKTKGLHIRRVHYFLQSSGKYKKLDGMPYRNINADWMWLQRCSKCARVLGSVEADAFEDRRNEDI